MAADLLKHVELGKLTLITSIGMITCELYSSKTTVDLAFVLQLIYDQLMHCQVVSELDKTLDHKSIKTAFYSSIRKKETLKYRA